MHYIIPGTNQFLGDCVPSMSPVPAFLSLRSGYLRTNFRDPLVFTGEVIS